MKRWMDWLLGWVELLEAEGRQSLRAVRRLAVTLAVIAACAGVLVLGAAALMGALYLGLARAVDPAWAALLTGLAAVLVGGLGLWISGTSRQR